MALEPTFFLQAAAGDPDIEYGGREMRLPFDALASRPGVCGPTDLKVTQRAEGANQSVDIAAGVALVAGDAATGQGKYAQRNSGKVNFTDIPAAPVSGTKTYLLCLQINDKQANGALTTYDPAFVLLPPKAGGAVADVPANALDLAEIDRIAGQASVLNAHIRNRRQLVTSFPSVVGHFRFWGGHGQHVLKRTRPLYAPSGTRGPVLGCTVANPRLAVVTDLLPGLWELSAQMTYLENFPGDRQVNVAYSDGDPTWDFLATGGGTIGETNADGLKTTTVTLGATPFVVRRGGSVQCTLWQDVVSDGVLNDGSHRLYFAGVYKGPLPGIY